VADIINLRRVKKNKARDDKQALAAANRLKFGQPKAERKLNDALQQQTDQKLDGHKRDTD
jgi:hypothetical protein